MKNEKKPRNLQLIKIDGIFYEWITKVSKLSCAASAAVLCSHIKHLCHSNREHTIVQPRVSFSTKPTPFSEVHVVTARSATVYGLRMSDDITKRHLETFYINRGYLIYICLTFSLLCFGFHWIFLIWTSAVFVIIFFKTRVCKSFRPM